MDPSHRAVPSPRQVLQLRGYRPPAPRPRVDAPILALPTPPPPSQGPAPFHPRSDAPDPRATRPLCPSPVPGLMPPTPGRRPDQADPQAELGAGRLREAGPRVTSGWRIAPGLVWAREGHLCVVKTPKIQLPQGSDKPPGDLEKI